MNKPDPDYIYDPDNWEFTYEWGDRSEIAENVEPSPGEVKMLSTLIQGPPAYLVRVVKSVDDAGDPDDTELQWFLSADEAKAAAAVNIHKQPGRGE